MEELVLAPGGSAIVPAAKPHGADQYHAGDGDPFRAMKRAYGITEADAAELRALGIEMEFRDFGADSPARGTFAIVHRSSGYTQSITPYTTPNLQATVRTMIRNARAWELQWSRAWALAPPPQMVSGE